MNYIINDKIKQTSVLQIATTDAWYATSLNSYFSSIAENYSSFLACLDACLDLEYGHAVEISTLLSEAGLTGYIIVPGYAKRPVLDVLFNFRQAFDLEQDYIYREDILVQDCIRVWRESYEQVKVLSTAYSAIANADGIPHVASDLFNQSLSLAGQLTEGTVLFSSYLNQTLQEGGTVEQITSLWNKFTGILDAKEVDESTEAEDPYMNSSCAGITGSTPGYAIDLSIVKDTIAGAAKVIDGILGGIFSGIGKGFKKVINNMAHAVIRTDVFDSLDDATPQTGEIDGYSYYLEDRSVVSGYWYDPTRCTYITNLLVNQNKLSSDWYKYDSIFGEMLMKFNPNEGITVKAYFKPTVINVKLLKESCSIFNDTTIGIDWTWPRFLSYYRNAYYGGTFTAATQYLEAFKIWLSNIAQFVQPLEPSDNTYNIDMALGVSFSVRMMMMIANMAILEANVQDSGSYFEPTNPIFNLNDPGYPLSSEFFIAVSSQLNNNYITGNINNLQLLSLCSGWIDSNIGFDSNCVPFIPSLTSDDMNDFKIITPTSDPSLLYSDLVSSSMLNMSIALLYHLYDKMENPFDFRYVPYAHSTSGFNQPKWAIRTDEQIGDARNRWITGFISAVIVTAVVITASVFFIKIKMKTFAKRQAKIAKYNNLMAKEGSLDQVNIKDYYKTSRKLGITSAIFGTSAAETLLAPNYEDRFNEIDETEKSIRKLIVSD